MYDSAKNIENAEAFSQVREEKRFVERCLADARVDITRLEAQNEAVTSELHEAQLSIAKTEGKLQAAQTRIGQTERDLTAKRKENGEFSEEIRKLRASLMQSGSDLEVENSALRHETQILKEKNGKFLLCPRDNSLFLIRP